MAKIMGTCPCGGWLVLEDGSGGNKMICTGCDYYCIVDTSKDKEGSTPQFKYE